MVDLSGPVSGVAEQTMVKKEIKETAMVCIVVVF